MPYNMISLGKCVVIFLRMGGLCNLTSHRFFNFSFRVLMYLLIIYLFDLSGSVQHVEISHYHGCSMYVIKSFTNFSDPMFGGYILIRISTSLSIVPLINEYCLSLSLIAFFRLNEIWSDIFAIPAFFFILFCFPVVYIIVPHPFTLSFSLS